MIDPISLVKLIAVLELVESGGDVHAFNKESYAVGILQIRQPVIDDVNRVYGLHFQLKNAESKEDSEKIAFLYLTYWSLHIKPSDVEHMALLWHAGPSGFQYHYALDYWDKRVKPLWEQENKK